MLRIKNTQPRRSRPAKSKTNGAVKFIRNTIISVIVLLILFVGGGVLYTWYMGKYNPAKPTSVVKPVATAVSPVRKAPQPASDAKVGVSIQLLNSPVEPGANTSITIRSNAGAKCTILVEYNKVPSKDSGLVPKTTDEYGMVTWTWTVEPTVPYGKWPVTVTCANAKNSGKVVGDLLVEKAAETTVKPEIIQ